MRRTLLLECNNRAAAFPQPRQSRDCTTALLPCYKAAAIPPHSKIAVIDAGVSGLTTAIVLSETEHEITIFAETIENTTSHAAAAIWFPYHIESEHAERWTE